MNQTDKMNGSTIRKDRLYQILDGQAEFTSPIIDASQLRRFGQQPTPTLVGPEQPLIRGAIIGCGGMIAVAFLQMINADALFKVLAFSITIVALIDAGIRALAAQRKIRTFTLELHNPLNELKEVRSYLNNYLTDLDRRTSRYFHCVTNTKVTTYCVLRQLQMSVDERIADIDKLLRWPTGPAVMEAFELLKKLLFFRDGFIRETGQIFNLTLERLKPTIVLLIEDLDRSLEELEGEIQVVRSQAEIGDPQQ